MQLEDTVAKGNCHRRKIGCILYDKQGVIISTGYNGPLSGQCNCPGKHILAGAGGNVECYAIHAEMRALLTANSLLKLHKCITNKAPCRACTLVLLGTSCQIIEFEIESNETENRKLWEKAGRIWQQKEKHHG